MADPRLRTIRIKSNVVKRIAVEKQSYEDEVKREKEKAVTLSENGTEEAVQKKQQEIIQESSMMVNDCRKRLKTALDDLIQVLGSAEDLATAEEYVTAQMMLMVSAAHATE